MNDIIPICSRTIAGKPARTVNARKLHEYLGVKSNYRDWFRNRIAVYGFEVKVDYLTAKNLARPKKIDHFVTLDMAKELAMVERTDKGREARRYFIDCEKQLRDQAKPKTLAAPPVKRQQLFSALVEDGIVSAMVPLPDDCLVITRNELNALRRPFDYFSVVSGGADEAFERIEKRGKQ